MNRNEFISKAKQTEKYFKPDDISMKELESVYKNLLFDSNYDSNPNYIPKYLKQLENQTINSIESAEKAFRMILPMIESEKSESICLEEKKDILESLKYPWKKYSNLKQETCQKIQEPISELKSTNDYSSIEDILDEYKKNTKKECYVIKYTNLQPNITDDKIGGIPYIPINEEYPLDDEGNPMMLLLQINMKNISLENYPNEGILEIFISTAEDIFLNFPEVSPGKISVKYYKDGLDYKKEMPNIDCSEGIINDKSGIKIELEKGICYMPYDTNDCFKIVSEIIKKLRGVDVNYPIDLERVLGINMFDFKKIINSLYFKSTSDGGLLGGYPFFVNDRDIDYNYLQDESIIINQSDNLSFNGIICSLKMYIDKVSLKKCCFDDVKIICDYD